MPAIKRGGGMERTYQIAHPEKMTREWTPARVIIPSWAPHGACRTDARRRSGN